MLYVGVASTALGFLLWLAILKALPAGTASLNMFAIPPIALVSSMLVFGERLTANEWSGIALHRRGPRDPRGHRVARSRGATRAP